MDRITREQALEALEQMLADLAFWADRKDWPEAQTLRSFIDHSGEAVAYMVLEKDCPPAYFDTEQHCVKYLAGERGKIVPLYAHPPLSAGIPEIK